MEFTIDASAKQQGREYYDVRILKVRGVPSQYGPGGYKIGIVPAGESGRREYQGPLLPGPWGFVFGLASVIDHFGGTAAEIEKARREGRLIDEIGDHDVLVVAGQRFVVHVSPFGMGIMLDPECTTCHQPTAYDRRLNRFEHEIAEDMVAHETTTVAPSKEK